jgi:ADP-dependent NAD(P)H-hydrate dehydratase / NAD(P)H-hydrate epimerase
MKAARVKEMQAMDRYAMETLAIPEEILMENAGLAAAGVLDREFGVRGKRYAVICGIGNNGGDGFVVARKILSNGGDARVFILGDAGRFQGAARANLNILERLPLDVSVIASPLDLYTSLRHMDGIVDAIFGTGLDREVGGIYGDAIDLINRVGKRVLSLDIPSGIHGETGQIMGKAVRAEATITFGLPKVGNLLYPGYGHCGKLYLSHISFPPSLYDREDLKIHINGPGPLPPRDPEAYKGSVGDCLFIAGAAGYFGAPYFSAMSFLKAGGGYSRLAAPASMAGGLALNGGEIVFVPQRETAAGSIAMANTPDLIAMSEVTDMVVIGPGLSLDAETQQLIREVARKVQTPLLIDGDGITALAEDLDILRQRTAPTVLTPHYGEMSRLTGKSIPEIRAGRIEILQQAAAALNAIIVLKGAHSLIGYPDGRVYINLSGNAGMATAGAGDVLTGTIAAMRGLGLPLDEAVRKGVYIHGLAGDLAAAAIGEDGMTAGDILTSLPLPVLQDRSGALPGAGSAKITICP